MDDGESKGSPIKLKPRDDRGRREGRKMGRRTEGEGPLTAQSKQDGRALAVE